MLTMIIKRFYGQLGILSFSLFLSVGCSAFHEVSVVSHGEDVVAVEEPVGKATGDDALASPETPSFPQLKEDEKDTSLSSLASTIEPLPIAPLNSAPSVTDSISQEIFSQSAEDTTLPWTLQDVFFDYDQMAIRLDAIPILDQNAQVLLKRYAHRAVLIQGHCDERGTEAYNLILGERRASAVKDYLVNLGVESSRLRVLSLGKSQPFCVERTIPCFRKNRRAHFVLK